MLEPSVLFRACNLPALPCWLNSLLLSTVVRLWAPAG